MARSEGVWLLNVIVSQRGRVISSYQLPKGTPEKVTRRKPLGFFFLSSGRSLTTFEGISASNRTLAIGGWQVT